MKILNPFHMNDWDLKKFLVIIISAQISLWGLIELDAMGLRIPILGEIISFIYLVFIPGILLLRVLKLHNLGAIETILFSIGLSLSTLMFLGYFLNVLSINNGIPKPLSKTNITILLSIVVFILSYVCYKTDKGYFNSSSIDTKDIFSIPSLCLYLLPLLTILGTYSVNFHQSNKLIICIILLIAIITLSIGFSDFIPDKLYPLTLFSISLSLLFHNSLISMYITGWDIHTEYSASSLVIKSLYWNPHIFSNVNAMLSIVILAPIFSTITDMNLVWVFKILYPCIYSMVPIGLYRIFQKQTNNKIAFFSVFFFIALFGFYTEMLQLLRQQIAELYLVLILLLLVQDNIEKQKSSILIILFTFSLVVSHYGLSYIYMGLIILTGVTIWLIQRKRIHSTLISGTYVLLTIAFILTWYMNVSDSSPFSSIVYIGDHILNSIVDFMNPHSAQGLEFITRSEKSTNYAIYKCLHIFTQFLITIGIYVIASKSNEFRFKQEYLIFCIYNYMMLVAGILIPFFASALNVSRLYQISLIFLAPTCVIGGVTLFQKSTKFLNYLKLKFEYKRDLNIMLFCIFIVIFFFFNVGLIFELCHDIPSSISINSTTIYPRFNQKEIMGATWLTVQNNNSNYIYADNYNYLLLFGFKPPWEGKVDRFEITSNNTKSIKNIKSNSYLFFGTYNIVHRKIIPGYSTGTLDMLIYTDYFNLIYHKNKIYNNAGAVIYF